MLTRRRRTHNFFTSPDRDTTLYKVDACADAAAEAPIRFQRQCHRWAHHLVCRPQGMRHPASHRITYRSLRMVRTMLWAALRVAPYFRVRWRTPSSKRLPTCSMPVASSGVVGAPLFTALSRCQHCLKSTCGFKMVRLLRAPAAVHVV